MPDRGGRSHLGIQRQIVVAGGTPAELFCRPELLRENHLRLPRIAHLMEVLRDVDGLDADGSAATIGAARREILRLLKEETV